MKLTSVVKLLKLHFQESYETKRYFVWFQIYRKTVNTINNCGVGKPLQIFEAVKASNKLFPVTTTIKNTSKNQQYKPEIKGLKDWQCSWEIKTIQVFLILVN